MPQSNGQSLLKRIEFEFDGNSYSFIINPEEYMQTEPNKATVTQTKGGAFVDQFGAGLVDISIKGTTGFKNGTSNPNSGFERYKELRDLIREAYKNTDASKIVKFYNYTDEEYWDVFVERFALSRSRTRALLYQYDIKLTGINRITDSPQGADGYIGNPFSAKDTTGSSKNGGYTGQLDTSSGNPSLNPANSQFSAKTQETLNTVTNNLSAVAGGYNGQFSPMIAKYITSNLSILETGDIPNLPSDTTGASATDGGYQYAARVSQGALNLFKSLKDLDPDLIETQRFLPAIPENVLQQGNTSDMRQMASLAVNNVGGAVDSVLVDAIKADKLQTAQVKLLQPILLETMNLYRGLSDAAQGKSGGIGMSESDIDRLSGNIGYMSNKLEQTYPLPIGTITELRSLSQNISHIKSLPELFSTTAGGW